MTAKTRRAPRLTEVPLHTELDLDEGNDRAARRAGPWPAEPRGGAPQFAVAQGRALLCPWRAEAEKVRNERARGASPSSSSPPPLRSGRAPSGPIPRPRPRRGGAHRPRGPRRRLGGPRAACAGSPRPHREPAPPGVGYGSPAYARTLDECVARWARPGSPHPLRAHLGSPATGIDLTFEAPFDENRRAVLARHPAWRTRAGSASCSCRTSGSSPASWRALIDPGDDAGLGALGGELPRLPPRLGEVAREAGTSDLLSVGVELRSWVTTPPRAELRSRSSRTSAASTRASLTYSANWDDVDDTRDPRRARRHRHQRVLPARRSRRAPRASELAAGGRARRGEDSTRSPRRGSKPVLFTEIGYTTRPDPAVRPWEWPDAMKHVRSTSARRPTPTARCSRPSSTRAGFAGFFVWRVYADPDDVSQEAEWGFSPRGKLAELVLRDAFTARWAVDGPRRWATRWAATGPGRRGSSGGS